MKAIFSLSLPFTKHLMSRHFISLFYIIVTVRCIPTDTVRTGLQCYICDSTSFNGYEEAERTCNNDNLRQCPDSKNSACMTEAFRRDSATYHVVKRCLNDCPVFLNSTAQHIRCCFKDACNDAIVTGMQPVVRETSSPPTPLTDQVTQQDLTQSTASSLSSTTSETSVNDVIPADKVKTRGHSRPESNGERPHGSHRSSTPRSSASPSGRGNKSSRNDHQAHQGQGRHRPGGHASSRSQRSQSIESTLLVVGVSSLVALCYSKINY